MSWRRGRPVDLRWRRLCGVSRTRISNRRVRILWWTTRDEWSPVLQTKVQGEIGVRAIASRAALHRRIRSVAAQISGKLGVTSSCNRLSTAAAEFCPGGIAAAALPAEHLDWFGRAPVERRSSDWNATAAAKSGVWCISMPAAWARDSARRGRGR